MHGKIGTDMTMVVVPILLLFLVGASRCDGSSEHNMGNSSNMTDEWINSGSGDISNDSNSSLTTESLTMSSTLLPTFSVPTSSIPTSSIPTSSIPTSSIPTSSLPLISTPTYTAPTMEPTSILTLSLTMTLGVTGVILLVLLLIFLGCVCYCCYLKKKEPANLGHVAKSRDEDITTTQCEAYELTKLGHEYEDPSQYQHPEYEIPVTQYENISSGYQNLEYQIPVEYENLPGYQNPEYEIPVTQCSAYALTSKPGK